MRKEFIWQNLFSSCQERTVLVVHNTEVFILSKKNYEKNFKDNNGSDYNLRQDFPSCAINILSHIQNKIISCFPCQLRGKVHDHGTHSLWDEDLVPDKSLMTNCRISNGSISTSGQCTCGSKRNIESLAKHPTINYTAFG